MPEHARPRPVARVSEHRPRGLRAMILGAAMVAIATAPAAAEDGPGLIVAHGISTFSELKYPADFPHLAYVNPDAPRGGEISLWSMGGFDSMHPYTTAGRAGALSSVFFESLLEATADTVGESYCLICETLEYPEDRSFVIFNMRPEVRFSDGTPLTAHDVVFSYEILLEKGLPDFRFVLAQQVEGAEALDDHRVKFTFREGWPTRDLPALVGGLPIFSERFYRENDRDFERSSMDPLMGSGPYVLERAVAGRSIAYRRNPDYWGWDLPIMQGRSNFDRIRIEYFADYDAAFEAFKGGAYHVRTEARALLWATGYDFPALQRGHVRRVDLPDGNLASGQSFIFNLRRPQFQDIRVREAIGLMFNFEWSNEALFNGLYARIHSFWENSELAADGLPGPEELAILEPLRPLLRPEVFTEPAVMAPSSGSRQLDRGNLRRASALLDEAGWDVGSDGLRRNANGDVLRIEFLNDNTGFDRIIEPFVSNLRRLGVDAFMTRVDPAQMTNRERSYDFDMITDQIRMSLLPGSSIKQYFGSDTADVSTFNKMGLRSEAVDRLLDIVLAAQSNEELLHATRALDRVLRSYRFWVPQWFKDTHWVAYFDMYGYPDELPPFALGLVDFWWFDAERAEALRAAGAIR
ncbi:MAG: ABC transporter substrate-binding protein [Rhodobacteraceae bacterium]|nr:ABC transporter substrate-binding protein [Paracoccaceae bacterium]